MIHFSFDFDRLLIQYFKRYENTWLKSVSKISDEKLLVVSVGINITQYVEISLFWRTNREGNRIAPAEMLKCKWEGQSSSTFIWC